MSAAWSAQQQRCLDALSFTLYRSANAAAPIGAVSSAMDPLLRALLRAAARDPSRADADAWMREMKFPSLAALRADPSAKRALWPRLRAARRERGRA